MESRRSSEPIDLESKNLNDSYEPSVAFRILEEDFTQIIQELTRHDRLGHFTNEFQRLIDCLKECYVKEQELIERNRTLRSQIDNNVFKQLELSKSLQSEREVIDKLQKEILKAWRMVDSAHTREQLAQETISNLRLQSSRLTQELETLRKMGSDQDQEVGAISKNKEALIREKERLLNEIQIAKEKHAINLKYQEELEKKNETAETKLCEISTDLEATKTELAKEKRFKEKLDDEVKDLRNDLLSKDQELKNQTNQANMCAKNVMRLEMHSREEKLMMDKLNKEMQELQNAYKLQKMEFEQLNSNNEKLLQDLQSKSQEIKSKDDDILKLKVEVKKLESLKGSLENKLGSLKNDRGMLEIKKREMQTKMTALEKEMTNLSKTYTSDKKRIEIMSREKEMMNKYFQKTTALTQEQQKFISLQEVNKKKLQGEIEEHLESLAKQRVEISGLRNEKDRLMSELVTLNNQIQDQLEELKLKEMELFDYKKRIASMDAKMKLQLAMFEQVRSERNQLSKTLAEANDEINELKHKLKIKSYQGQQLKEDIQTKDNLLVKDEFTIKRMGKEKDEVKGELQKALNALREKKEQVTLLAQEENRLQKIIQDSDKDRAKLSKDLNQVSNERDILGTQLVRRNDELSLLYERIKILQSVLQKGEIQYSQRLEDIRLLKIEIKKLRQEKAMLARSIENTADLRQEIFHLERDFTQERLKCRALEEELQNPLNVHRWRKLEGSDPTTYELVLKTQILQKRLLTANAEALKRESQLKEVERLNINLKEILGRQPGPEAFEKMKRCQRVLKQRGVKIKCLIAELTMFENESAEYKFEKYRTDKELQQLKKKFYRLKKREHRVKNKEKELAQQKTFLPVLEPITRKPVKPRYVGAGFNVATVPCVPRTPAIHA